MRKIFILSILFLIGLPSFCEPYPKEMLQDFSKEYLDLYFSLPKEQRGDPAINQWGQYPVIRVKKGDKGYLNSKYAPDTIIYPFRTKEQQAQADYYFELGLQMPKP